MTRRRFEPLTTFGIPLVGGALLPLPRYQWWVDPDTTQTDVAWGNGKTEEHPFQTLQEAIDAAEADRGDLIFVKPGSHGLTTMLDINKRAITICAYDHGMPRHMRGENFTVNAAASLDTGPVATITDPCRIIGMGFAGRDTTAESLLIDCEEAGGFAGGFSELVNCRFSNWYGAMTHGIKQIGGAGNRIAGCSFDGLFGGYGTSAIGFYNDTGGFAPAYTLVEECYFQSTGTGKHAIVHAVGSVPVNFIYRRNHLVGGWAAQGKFLDNNSVAAIGICEENYLAPLADQASSFENTVATIGFANNHYEEA